MNSQSVDPPMPTVRRSGLIMPVHVERFVQGVWRRGVDNVTLDLEDSVPPAQKAAARLLVRDAITAAGRGGAVVGVRINRESWQADIEASVWPGLRNITFPKAEDPAVIAAAGDLIERLERERGLPEGSVGLSLIIETVAGLEQVDALRTAHPRLTGAGGPADVDFTADLGIVLDATLDSLEWARGEMDLFQRATGGRGLNRWAPGRAITEYGDEDAIRRAADRKRRDGGRGGGGIHPSLVAPQNAGYTPPDEEMAEAAAIVAAFDAAWARGAATAEVRGRIVTKRTAEAAREYIRYGQACRAEEARKADLRRQIEQGQA
ncbi:MAG: aldolase/citrate lyase family protein [Dehalococcoidia bacterium]